METESFLKMVPADRLEGTSVLEPVLSVDRVLGFISRGLAPRTGYSSMVQYLSSMPEDWDLIPRMTKKRHARENFCI